MDDLTRLASNIIVWVAGWGLLLGLGFGLLTAVGAFVLGAWLF